MTQKILVIRSGAIGDVIMATPFLRNLRENLPDADISFLVGNWSRDVLKNNPNVDKIIGFDDEIIIRKKPLRVLSLISRLRKEGFDLCFVLDKSWMWSLFAFLCGIRERIGFSRGNEGMLNTRSVGFDGSKNEAEYDLDLLKKLRIKPKTYAPEIFSTKKDKDYADRFLRKNEIRGRIIGICPGGAANPGQNAAVKRWPPENYVRLIDSDTGRSSFITFGSRDDKDVAEDIMRRAGNKRIYDATGSSIQEAKELMRRCSVIISHDSGSLHIASTAGTRIIALFGPTPAKRFCPRSAVCIMTKTKPCYDIYGRFRNCKEGQMGEISVERIVKEMGRK